MDNKENILDNLVVISFADNKVPEFKEVKSKDWVLYGENNLFPSHLLYLFDKSSNHGAIVNGKANYVFGKGLAESPVVNEKGETLNKILSKAVIDFEIFNGFYLQCVWDKLGKKAYWYHMPFQKIRIAKDGKSFFYADNWDPKKGKVNPTPIKCFDPNDRKGAQLFAFYSYRPGSGKYPLPGYMSALNDIETDVEISKYNLSVIKNGMFPSKWINFTKGDPGVEGRRKIEKAIQDKFSGSENAGRFFLYFGAQNETLPNIQDLSATDLDKLFDQLNKTTQAEIFSGHQVTSPMLFGIMEPGKLGGRNELRDAYEIFKNTYVNGRQQEIEEAIKYLAPSLGISPDSKLIPVEPISATLSPTDFKEILPREWVYEKLGINPEDYDLPEVASNNPSGETKMSDVANEHLKNLTGRQMQNIQRIIRKYKSGNITRQMAETMLKSGINLTDDQVCAFLDFSDEEKSKADLLEEEIQVAEMFANVGEPRANYTIIKSRTSKKSTAAFEEHQMFKDVKGVDSAIVDLIKKDKRVTAQVIAETLDESVDYIKKRIKSLINRKILTVSTQSVGADAIIEHSVNTDMISKIDEPETVDMLIRYSYEVKSGVGPAIIKTSRPFCKKMIELDRLYSRSEIESISRMVGYSVWDRKGGFWGDSAECRHRWVSHVVLKKQ